MLIMIGLILFLVALILFSFNIWGLYRELRPQLESKHLHFIRKSFLSYEDALKVILRQEGELDKSYCDRLCFTIPKMLAHIRWTEFDEALLNQLVPVRENYILHFMGAVLNLQDYKRYHFTDYRRSLRRGIGVCGDACMILSQLLDRHNISNRIVSFRGHVLVEVVSNGTSVTYDPDFGVAVPHSPESIHKDPSVIKKSYSEAGYDIKTIEVLAGIYSEPLKKWNGVRHFVKKKYWFEKVAYIMKWGLPLLLTGIMLWFINIT